MRGTVVGEGKKIVGRFAPTPRGRMHLGDAFAALLVWLDVRAQGGELVLRMEDLDRERCRPEYRDGLLEDLAWLGLTWDRGYPSEGGEYLQSSREEVYKEAVVRLEEKGLLYPCYCNRRERLAAHAPHASDGTVLYGGRCRGLTPEQRGQLEEQGRRPALRIRVPHEKVAFLDGHYGVQGGDLDTLCGDFILRRSDGVFAYQLAVVVDDALQGVNRVVRGCDLLPSTPQQIWLCQQLGYPVPSYAHVPLLTDGAGRRLSKRDGDLEIAALRQHHSPWEIIGRLAHGAGLLEKAEPITPEELLTVFSWDKVRGENLAWKSSVQSESAPS